MRITKGLRCLCWLLYVAALYGYLHLFFLGEVPKPMPCSYTLMAYDINFPGHIAYPKWEISSHWNSRCLLVLKPRQRSPAPVGH